MCFSFLVGNFGVIEHRWEVELKKLLSGRSNKFIVIIVNAVNAKAVLVTVCSWTFRDCVVTVVFKADLIADGSLSPS